MRALSASNSCLNAGGPSASRLIVGRLRLLPPEWERADPTLRALLGYDPILRRLGGYAFSRRRAAGHQRLDPAQFLDQLLLVRQDLTSSPG